MPRTHLTEKFCKPKVPPPNYLSELLKRYKKASRLTDEEIAEQMGTSRKTVNTYLNQKPENWNIGDLKQYCTLLGIPFETAAEAVLGSGETRRER